MSCKIFIGWDSREPDAYTVAEYSLRKRASVPLEIFPLKQEELRAAGHYWRALDPLASTEFTYTRFLTPFLAQFQGRAIFCDCDFLWLADIAELLDLVEPAKAVSCVQHRYEPTDKVKMDGAAQTQYPRKNWSSLMVFNCEHPSVRKLTVEAVNAATPAYLHRMQWADDTEIGDLPVAWNWLEGWNAVPETGTPKAIHFTRGGPWFEAWKAVQYAALWEAELAEAQAAGIGQRDDSRC